MIGKYSASRRTFFVFNYFFLIIAAFLCIFPMIHVLAISFSSRTAAAAGMVTLFPVDITTKSYEFIFKNVEFWKALLVSVKRILIGVPVQMLFTCMIAYPLSRKIKTFKMRSVYAWFFFFTALFGGGLIPHYLVVFKTGLVDSIWALVIPGAVPIFSVIVLLNFFKQIPEEIEESAFIDGAGHWVSLWKIYVPLSLPALATLTLFASVGHWNAWFDGIIYMNKTENYPLQSYLQTVVIAASTADMRSIEDIEMYAAVSDQTFKAAQIFIATLPILLVYPFLQRYFMTGIVLGSVKG